ncbi:MAG: hypothetical protein GX379_00075 [Clostridiales bacterium]|jgi:Na+/H+ antiporter NhaC|nr:hypothetical protein [Clostridiales bacterium]
MKKRLKEYLTYLEGLDYENMTENDRKNLKAEMLNQISFFQHERLVHLIVTITFAIMSIIAVFGFSAWPELTALIITALLLALLIPYIFHYYYLENGVQKLYKYYDKCR